MKKLILFCLILILAVSAFSQVEKVRVLSLDRYISSGYGIITVQFRVLIANPLGSSAQCKRILKTYANEYGIIRVDSINGNKYAVVIQTESFTLPKTKSQLRTAILARLTSLQTKLDFLVANLEVYDTMVGESYIDNSWEFSPQIDSL